MRKFPFMVSVALCAIATPAFAQDASAPAPAAPQASDATDAGNSTGDIIVTATRRSESLANVPLAVSAVTAESLQNSGANDIRQLNQLAPSLLVSSTGSEANGSARIRGVGTVGDNPGLESSVATFIDGVYRSRTGAGLNDLGELERIEVLRGPQGTLFGRNASAGLLNIITKKPEFTFGGTGEATYGNYDYYRLSAGVTGPITDTIAARIDGVYSKRDGYFRNVDATGRTLNRINNRDRYFVRGQLLFQPTTDISFRLIGDYTHRREACCAGTYISTVETFDPTPGAPGTNPERDYATRPNRIVDILQSLGGIFPAAGDPYNRRVATTPGRSYNGKTTDGGISGELNWNFGGASLTSITAYREYKAETPGDFDYSNVDLLFRANDGNSFRKFKTFSQELRLQGSAFNDKLDWLVGGYFSNEKLQVRDNLQFGSQYGAFAACRIVATINPAAVLRNPNAPGCLSPTGIAALSAPAPVGFGAAAPLFIGGLNRLSTVNNVGDNPSDYFQRSRNYAIFTHNIVHVTDTISVTLGLRYTDENKTFRANFNNTNAACPAQQAMFSSFLTGGANAALLPGVAQALAQGIVNLTCQGNSTTGLNALNLNDKRKEHQFTGTGVISWKPTTELLTYASYSKGYKAGGFNLDRSALGNPVFAPTDPRQSGVRGAGFGSSNLQFDAEKVDAYEIGFKYNGRRFNLNVAAFRQDFKNFQLNTFNGSVFIVQNVDSCGNDLAGADRDNSGATGSCGSGKIKPGVRAQGVEVEASIYPSRNVAITAGYTYAHTHFRKNLVGRDTGTPLDPALFLLPGSQLSNAPENVITSSIAWTPEIGSTGLSGLVYVDQRTSSDYNTGSDLFPEKRQDGFTTVNARLGVRGPEQRWAIEVWAQNVFNKNYQQVAFASPFQGAGSVAQVQAFGGTANQTFSSYLAEPRTYGLTVRGKF
ncbi:TonB-dependent receptor [Sphingomonas sp.]|uniref:TonB-dependent receptor n=1 Tax=Sphingomonas sp. TaxID=28214 RepID=UPI0025E94440|nr:TonB-dependent receptor [Sphingomonas sp.]